MFGQNSGRCCPSEVCQDILKYSIRVPQIQVGKRTQTANYNSNKRVLVVFEVIQLVAIWQFRKLKKGLVWNISCNVHQLLFDRL